ncbi:FKBP-type peptidyl-prolyl cis-trans isomerase [Lysobacter yananisis]|uniref:Peptidyl-prolyl cis-trans isomerase n=1 Tax=Lysobacter yananisis TaxID=1003114 RepID=A0ABY9PFF1_9GAMM|nr:MULTISPECIES: FKBP-type peptidyl-prolyl cis-trans isomerase [Lysobacter]UZW60895.1 FKBP-type peptidyl-prolyl cis-trans isomerase [Lysobacter enzymogenes]WMT04780.1 FKBP-type peptidyl-prolyl cis-trans isomerase [Lysobacter yananisis]
MPRSLLVLSALSLALAAALVACAPSGGPKPGAAAAPAPLAAADVASEKARISYVVGRDFARSVEPIRAELDAELVLRAIRDAQAGRPSLFDESETKRIRDGFSAHLRDKHDQQVKALAARNLAAGEAFLSKNANADGVKTTASGLQYQMLREGKGAHPKASDTVRVNYVGTLIDGRKFESTYDTDHPAEFVLAQVMPGWTEGVQLMAPGAKYRFWMPPKLAYGERGLAGQIEPNSVLAFEVELLEIAGQGAPTHDE